jgi:hypothetical protein
LCTAICACTAFKETVSFFGYDVNGAKRGPTLFVGKEGGVKGLVDMVVGKLKVFFHESSFGGFSIAAEALT